MKFHVGDQVLAPLTKDGPRRLARINDILLDGMYGLSFLDAAPDINGSHGFCAHGDDLELVERKVSRFQWITKGK